MRSRVLVLAAATLALAACTAPLKLVSTSRSPSTDALIKVEHDENGNGILTLSVNHLPPPARLGAGLTTYVVWVSTPDQKITTNVGMLKVNDSQTGSMQATTPLREMLIKVTAEENGEATVPSQNVVIEGAVKRP